MDYRQLGTSGLRVPALSFGAGTFGGAGPLFSAWGNSWDKRVQWDAWVAWTRILLQAAEGGPWPERLDKLNNVALRGAH